MGSGPIVEGSDPWVQSFDAVAWMPREGLAPVGKGRAGLENFKSNRFPRHECNEICYNVEAFSWGMSPRERKAE